MINRVDNLFKDLGEKNEDHTKQHKDSIIISIMMI